MEEKEEAEAGGRERCWGGRKGGEIQRGATCVVDFLEAHDDGVAVLALGDGGNCAALLEPVRLRAHDPHSRAARDHLHRLRTGVSGRGRGELH